MAIVVGRFGPIELSYAARLPWSLHSAGRIETMRKKRRPAPVGMTEFFGRDGTACASLENPVNSCVTTLVRNGRLRGVVYHVYILASASGVLYTGVTGNLERRVLQHKKELLAGFTKKYQAKRLVYFEGFSDVRDAIIREKQIKGWRREKRLALIHKMNPKFHDLSKNLLR